MQGHNGFFEGVELVGVTGTYYADKTDPRFDLAIETAELYEQANLPLVAIDASPGRKTNEKWVEDELKKHGAFVIEATVAGIATQCKQGVAAAIDFGANKIVSHEPEKTLMVTFAQEIIGGLNTNDILVIGRSEVAEDSLPPVQ